MTLKLTLDKTTLETELIDYVKMMADYRAKHIGRHEGYKYASVESFLLAHGEKFTSAPLPAGIEAGEPRHCYNNAYYAVDRHPHFNLSYVEGVAYVDGLIPVDHAWAVDAHGHVIDPTWEHERKAGRIIAYFGVKLPMSVVRKTMLARGRYGVLHNMEQRYPILRDGLPDPVDGECPDCGADIPAAELTQPCWDCGNIQELK